MSLLQAFFLLVSLLRSHLQQISAHDYLFVYFEYLGLIFTASLVYSLDIVKVTFEDNRRGIIACYVDSNSSSCTNCDCDEPEFYCPPEARQCPEWTSRDVSRIVQTQLKQSVTLAAIFFIYAFSALRFGLDLRRSQIKYQIAYV